MPFAMNRNLCCLLFTVAALLLTTGCRDDLDREIDAAIHELNDVIRNEAVYVGRRHSIIRKYQHIADTTRSDRTRAWAYITQAGHYSHFQLDSSAYYCMQALTLAEQLGDKRLINDAKVRTAIVLIGNVELAEANRVLRSIDTTNSRDVDLTLYYRTRATVFRESKRFSVFPEVERRYNDSLKYYLNAYIARASGPRITFHKKNFRAELLRLEGRNQEALEMLEGLMRDDIDSLDIFQKASITYQVARNYTDMGDTRLGMLWAARASIYELSASTRAHMSLYRLAQILYETGEIRLANAYIKRTLNDLTVSNYRLRIGQYAEALDLITKSFDQSMHSKLLLTLFTAISLSVLLIIILWQAIHTLRRKREIERLKDSYFEINRQLTDINQRLNATNSELVRTNDQLNDANKIKSEYVSQYMQLCSSYIQRLDTYRMGIIKLLKTENAEQTLITLRSQELIQTEHRNFLRLFDETFLGLFPDFIEQVRNLLLDPERFMPKRSRQLSTELRYLALVRLGVSDSAQIALFLNSTLSTIYTYRARLRNDRIDKTSDIEEQIRRICLS